MRGRNGEQEEKNRTVIERGDGEEGRMIEAMRGRRIGEIKEGSGGGI